MASDAENEFQFDESCTTSVISGSDALSLASDATTVDLQQLLADQRCLSTSRRGVKRAAAGDDEANTCRLDGKPVKPHKQFCPEHHRAYECIKRQCMKGSTDAAPTEQATQYLGICAASSLPGRWDCG